MIRITVYAGVAEGDEVWGSTRKASTSVREVESQDVHEELRQIGLEWKTADYMPERQVVITLDPIENRRDDAELRHKVRAAATALEETGML